MKTMIEVDRVPEELKKASTNISEIIAQALTAGKLRAEALANQILNSEPFFNRETALAFVHSFIQMFATEPAPRKKGRELKSRIQRLVLIVLLMIFLVSCADTVANTPTIDNNPIVTQVEDSQEVIQEEIETDSEENIEAQDQTEIEEEAAPPLTEEETVEAPPQTEVIQTPIPTEVVISAIATSEYQATVTPGSVETVTVNISIAYEDGYAYITTRTPDGSLRVERVVAVRAERTGDTISLINPEGNVTATIDVLSNELTVTPEPAPEPADVEEEETVEPPDEEETPVEEETPAEETSEEQTMESPFTLEELDLGIHTLPFDQEGIDWLKNGNFNSFYALAGETEIVDIRYDYGEGEYDYIIFKSLQNIWININGEIHNFLVPTSGIVQRGPEEFYTFFGNIATTTPLSGAGEANLYTGEILMNDWQRLLNTTNPDANIQIVDGAIFGETLRMSVIIGQNPHVLEAIADPYGTSDSATGPMAMSFNLEDFLSGDNLENLPSLPDGSGRKFIPTLRVEFLGQPK